MAACLEAMMAQVFLAVVIARLVGMLSGPKRPPPPDPTDHEEDRSRSARE
jgi:hypothetical protein